MGKYSKTQERPRRDKGDKQIFQLESRHCYKAPGGGKRSRWQNIQNLVQLALACSVWSVWWWGPGGPDINDLHTISSEKGDKKVVSRL